MRLGNMYLFCKMCIDIIRDISLAEQTGGSGQNTYKYWALDGWSKYMKPLNSLRAVGALEPTIKTMLGVCADRTLDDRVSLDSGGRKKFQDSVNLLLIEMNTIINLCETLGYEGMPDGVTGFDVKLPADADMSVHLECIKELQFLFDQFPYLQKLDGSIKFRSIDVGSEWWTFILAAGATTSTLVIMKQLIALWDAAIALRSHNLTLERQRKLAERAEANGRVKDDFMNRLIEFHAELTRLETDRLLGNIVANSDIKLDPEEMNVLTKCMNSGAILLSKGVEIYSAIDGDKEITPVFPPIETQRLPIADLKLLTPNSKDSE